MQKVEGCRPRMNSHSMQDWPFYKHMILTTFFSCLYQKPRVHPIQANKN